jgi:hypothetical protein
VTPICAGSFHLPFPVWSWRIGLLAHGLGTAGSLMGAGLHQRLLDAELASLQRH